MALLTVAILTLQELARAARSAEKLLDMLNRELPPTLNDLRLVQAQKAGVTTRSLLAGATAAFRVLTGPPRRRRRRPPTRRPPVVNDARQDTQRAAPRSAEHQSAERVTTEHTQPDTTASPEPKTSTELPNPSTSLPTKSP